MHSDFASGGDRFVVVEVETTGLYGNDRMVEVADVTVSGEGAIVDAWDTLANPERDGQASHRPGTPIWCVMPSAYR